MSAKNYPEHAKLEAIKDKSQAIGEFLTDAGYTLCEWHRGLLEDGEGQSGWMPVRGSVQRVLADYFEIDLDMIEVEKRVMLDELRRTQAHE